MSGSDRKLFATAIAIKKRGSHMPLFIPLLKDGHAGDVYTINPIYSACHAAKQV